MTQQPVDTTGRSYRTAFLLACAAIVVLAIGIAALAWRLHRQTAPPVPPPSTAAAAGTTTTPKSDEALITSAAPPLAPIQLSPQRMQSIGVQIGRVADRVVNDDLRLTGTVEVNERRVSYVQSRVAGWIRDVRVDATGDLVRQGQTLFTIYSPDLAATEREYLLAKKNASELAHSPVAGVAAGAA
jgi:Cu(I)/Ag(I) efflux system membrane fusion protein/cobalt-zinc-cadmium efflux system membrane fusion protein